MSRTSFHIRQAAFGAAAAMVLVVGSASTACADSPPKVDRSFPTAAPDYPAAAQTAGEQGDVLVDVYVNASGKPRKFKIHQSSGFPDLDNSAAQAVANWRFVPAVQNGDNTSAWTTVKIHFELPHPEPAAAAPAAQH
ncbi:MAG TPA: energy transducer TonB [Rhizomicrobium sp.]|nr:energy transducer TonB [Rhizomicrobium sp.]